MKVLNNFCDLVIVFLVKYLIFTLREMKVEPVVGGTSLGVYGGLILRPLHAP